MLARLSASSESAREMSWMLPCWWTEEEEGRAVTSNLVELLLLRE
jgi:hypothetical protein